MHREPRLADLAAIATLERQVSELQQQLSTAEQRYQRLRQEVLLREETFNQRFAAGGAAAAISVGAAASAGEQLMGWLKGGTAGGQQRGGSGGKPVSPVGSLRLPVLGSSGGKGLSR